MPVFSCSGPFRPEWIKELRVVEDNDAYNPDVQYNNGHLMMQTTFFIGPVNFYYELRGKKYCFEANTGDSNFISPFVKHSFTSRDPNEDAIIIAVTYGGGVRKALPDFARMGAESSAQLAGDLRDPEHLRRSVLARHLMAENMSATGFAHRLADVAGLDQERADALVQGAAPDADEVAAMADELNVSPSELMFCERMSHHQEVVITQRASDTEAAAPWVQRSKARSYPDDDQSLVTYAMEPLSRTPHQPHLKTFNVAVNADAKPGARLQSGVRTRTQHLRSAVSAGPLSFRMQDVSFTACAIGLARAAMQCL